MAAPTPDQLHAINLKRLEHEYKIEQDRAAGVQALGLGGLKVCVLLNGGALVALFTLLGNLDRPAVEAVGVGGAQIREAFVFFVIGLVSAGLAHIAGYVSQELIRQDDAIVAKDTYQALRDGRTREDTPRRRGFFGDLGLLVAILLCASSLGCFAAGSRAALPPLEGAKPHPVPTSGNEKGPAQPKPDGPADRERPALTATSPSAPAPTPASPSPVR